MSTPKSLNVRPHSSYMFLEFPEPQIQPLSKFLSHVTRKITFLSFIFVCVLNSVWTSYQNHFHLSHALSGFWRLWLISWNILMKERNFFPIPSCKVRLWSYFLGLASWSISSHSASPALLFNAYWKVSWF